MLVLLPFGPALFVLSSLGDRRQRARLRGFRLARSVGRDGGAFTLTLEDGTELRVDPAAVREARMEEWGDGINGSRIDAGLILDQGLRVRFDGWSKDFRPLVQALRDHGSLSKPAEEHRHPDGNSSYLFVLAVLGAVIDLIALGIWSSTR
jgi:hypothetical protein